MSTTAKTDWIAELQGLVTNQLEPDRLRGRRVAAILGDVPSTYAKSPTLWNAAFTALEVNAIFVPLDVPAERLPAVVKILRGTEGFLGGSVTVPYKARIIPLLDAVDPMAERIGAVNAIARTADGRLIGYNTDGLGGVRALTETVVPGQTPPLRTLADLRVLLMGCGGAAQALAVYLQESLGSGELVVANRTAEPIHQLFSRLRGTHGARLMVLSEADILTQAPTMDVIINATVKGQAGIRRLPDGQRTCLEPYSAVASAQPARLPAGQDEAAFRQAWLEASAADIASNQTASIALCTRLPRRTVCYDIIYAPLESVFLQHARWSGHRTLNGKGMNVAQAVAAFTEYVCRDWLIAEGWNETDMIQRVRQAMLGEWAK